MVIDVKNVVKRYGDLIALDHFNMQVQEGEIFGLLGPNGSGKTTAMNCILSLLKYNKGTIEVFGKPISPDAYDIKSKMGVILQNVVVFHELTVFENIDYFCGMYVTDKKKRKELVEEAIAFVGLKEYRKFYPNKLSGGLLRRLNIACGIAHKPKLILLDEPTVAVDPQSRNNILEGIKKLNKEGATIVYTSHYMEEVEELCSRIAIMDKGKIVATGTKDELKAMIGQGEKLSIEVLQIEEELLQEVKRMSGIVDAYYEGNLLVAKSKQGQNSLIELLECLKQKGVGFGRVYAEPPTLNDVFLEITGKALRD